MTYRGSMRNGVVVFDAPVPLAEGDAVEVQPLHAPPSRPVPGSPEAMRELITIDWAGDPEELRRLQAELQEMRDEDAQAFGNRDDRSPLDDDR
jgi:hypothetical protein